MSLTIRPADLAVDAEQMIKLLAASVNPRYDHARFEWLYEQNPDGRARAWVAVDPRTEAIAGTAAAVPRRVHVGDRIELGWVLSDFCIAERYRALGPALQLQRACLAPAASGEIPFCYDLPSDRMLAVYRRLTIAPALHLRRYAKLLRVGRTLRGLKLPPAAFSPVTATVNTLLGLQLRHRAQHGLQVALHDGLCGEEFTDVDAFCSRQHAACTRRSAEYLNWRFLANPFRSHEIVCARREGTLIAYAVIASDREAPAIVDLFGPADPSAIRALLTGTLAMLHAGGAVRVSITLAETHPWAAVLAELGFRARDRSPLVVYSPKASPTTADALASPAWLLTKGDLDS